MNANNYLRVGFDRSGDRVTLRGYAFSGRITVRDEHGRYMVLHKRSATAWAYVGGTSTEEAEVWLVRVEGDHLVFLDVVEGGGRKAIQRLCMECHRLAWVELKGEL